MTEEKKDVVFSPINNAGSGKIENENLVAVLTYFLVGIIWYFADEKIKKSGLVKFHTKQAINLMLISVAINTFLGITLVGIFLLPLVGFITSVFAVIGIINAANSKQNKLPIIGGLVEKYLEF